MADIFEALVRVLFKPPIPTCQHLIWAKTFMKSAPEQTNLRRGSKEINVVLNS